MAGCDYSIVEYYAEHERYRCGYCKCVDTNYSHGMWAHNMTVQDYQDLIDRGWRRSGRYCYKPTMHVTCCPMYTIKCSSLDFKPSKSQKKVLKRMHRFMASGDVKSGDDSIGEGSETSECADGAEMMDVSDAHLHTKSLQAEKSADSAKVSSVDPSLAGRIGSILMTLSDTITDTLTGGSREACNTDSVSNIKKARSASETMVEPKKVVQAGRGGDVNLPPRKKAKLIRLERKKEKLMKRGLSEDEAKTAMNQPKKPPPQAKSLEDFLNESLPENAAHRLELRIVHSDSAEFHRMFKESHALYTKYQIFVHKETAEECNLETFCDFLVASPLQLWKPPGGPPQGYGSFHQQYWLDGRLIAVGVVDILPKCVSSVYFYYDPEMGQLSLGTYASLRELALTRSLHQYAPELKYYYMGFYIHTCPKMRYKAAYSPSYLLCPETYTWHAVEKCREKLDVSRYSRFDDDGSAGDGDGDADINQVLVVFRNRAMPYSIYCTLNEAPSDLEETRQYASLVGMKCAKKMLLVKH